MNVEELLKDIERAEIQNTEINHLAYDPNFYTDVSTLLTAIDSRKQITPINLAQLSLNGRVINDSFDAYLSSHHDGSNTIKEVLKTPLHYWCAKHEKNIKTSKKAFELGTFCHLAFLEPERFDRYVIEPKASMASIEGVNTHIRFWEEEAKKIQQKTKKRIISDARRAVKRHKLSMSKMDGKKDYLNELKERTGIESVDNNTYCTIQLIKRHYYQYGNGIIPKLLKGCAFETSFYGHDQETGLPVKVRPDAFNIEENLGANVLISFKTTSAESIDKMQYDAAKYQYQLSEGMYLDVMTQVTGRKFTAVICIMVQTQAPFLPAVFIYNPEDLANGLYRYKSALTIIRDCIKNKTFPGFDASAQLGNSGIIEMNLPEWSKKELIPVEIQ